MNVQYIIIDSDSALVDYCQHALGVKRIAIDSEFMRSHTLYPQLGLIQLYDGHTVSLIDPFMITDWEPLRILLQDPQVEKVSHASGEDITVLHHYFGIVIKPLLDTQILAAFIGEHLSSGFVCLVRRYLNIFLDKSAQCTNWLARPLTIKQLNYAAKDVYYLLPLAEILIEKAWRYHWLTAARGDCAQLVQRRTKLVNPQYLYYRITNNWLLESRSLACLKQLVAWRFFQACLNNLAVNFIIKEDELWRTARYLPTSTSALKWLKLDHKIEHYYASDILDIVGNVLELPKAELPLKLKPLIYEINYRQALIVIKEFITTIAQSYKINKTILASQRQINQLLAWHWNLYPQNKKNLPQLLTGWRAEILGQGLTALLTRYPSSK